jgi:hypothetical protein
MAVNIEKQLQADTAIRLRPDAQLSALITGDIVTSYDSPNNGAEFTTLRCELSAGHYTEISDEALSDRG